MGKSTQLKNQVVSFINSLPDDSTLEDIQYHLYVREKVEQGMKAIEEGRLVSQEDAEAKVKKWLLLHL